MHEARLTKQSSPLCAWTRAAIKTRRARNTRHRATPLHPIHAGTRDSVRGHVGNENHSDLQKYMAWAQKNKARRSRSSAHRHIERTSKNQHVSSSG